MSFNIYTDLKDGDKIKRINSSFCNFIKDNIYTFKRYNNSAVLEVHENCATGDIVNFEFVINNERKELKIEISYLNDYEALIQVVRQTHFNDSFGKNDNEFTVNDFTLKSINIVEASNSSFFVRGEHSKYKSTIVRRNYLEELERYCKNLLKAVDAYNEFFSEKYPMRKEFIHAMKVLISEYALGKHVFDVVTCKFCNIVAKYKNQDTLTGPLSTTTCAICPWVKITGNVCHKIEEGKELGRILELIEWIEIYEGDQK